MHFDETQGPTFWSRVLGYSTYWGTIRDRTTVSADPKIVHPSLVLMLVKHTSRPRETDLYNRLTLNPKPLNPFRPGLWAFAVGS